MSEHLVLHSSDGERFVSARLGYLPPAATANVGVMCVAPEGRGFESIFDRLKLEPTAG